MNKKTILLSVFLFLFLTSFSQKKVPRVKKTIRGEFQLPRALSNKAFTKVFSGVFNSGISMNFGFDKKYNIGGYYCYTQYQIFPKFFDDPHSIHTNNTAGLKFTYDKVLPKGIFSPYVAAGFNWIKYSRIKCDSLKPFDTEVNAINIGAGLTYNFFIDDEWTGAGFTLGYNFTNHVFNPDAVCLQEFFNFSESERSGYFQNIYFGFSLYFDLAREPNTSPD